MRKTIITKGGTIPSTVTWYEISALGIDKIEGGSEFEPKDRYEGINITATGTNVVTLGDGNVVNAQFSPLREQLDGLKSRITASDLGEKEELDVVSDIRETQRPIGKGEPGQNYTRSSLGRH